MRKKIKNIIAYLFAEHEKFSLEHRLLLSAIIVAILISIVAAVINSILTTSAIATFLPVVFLLILIYIYIEVRFKNKVESFTNFVVIVGILSAALIWVFNGGIDGANIIPALVILMLGLFIVQKSTKKYILLLFIFSNIIILLIQRYRPEIIVKFPSETDRWIDNLISVTYSAYFIYLIVSFVHKNYTIERQRAEENEAKFRSLYDNSPDMHLSISAHDATILRCNKTLIKVLGYSKEELIGESVFNIYHSDCYENVKNVFKIFLETGIISNQELIVKRKDGSIINVSLNAEAKRNEKGEILYSISSWRDITEQKQAELIIKQQNKELTKLNIDKDRFIAVLSHDLRTPFNAILGFTELLQTHFYAYTPEQIKDRLQIISDVSKKTYSLLEELLLWSNAQSGKLDFQPKRQILHNICNNVHDSVDMMAKVKNISIQYFVNDNIEINADENMLKIIFRNLITNAIKYSYHGGAIRCSSVVIQNKMIITISDDGVGIGQDKIEKLFDDTQIISTEGTDNEKGTGIGLLLCKEFVEKHGGRIWVESEVGKGSNFKVELPMYNPSVLEDI